MELALSFVRTFVQLAVICTLIIAGLRHVMPTLRHGIFVRQVGALWAVLVVLAGTTWTLAAVTLVGGCWLGWRLRSPERRLAIRQALVRQCRAQPASQHGRRPSSGMVIVEGPVRPAEAPRLPAPDQVLRVELPRRRREDRVRSH
jgi:hypothetical protein